MKPYLIVKVLEMASVCVPTTTVYSNVELRSSSADSREELAALEACAKKLNLDFIPIPLINLSDLANP